MTQVGRWNGAFAAALLLVALGLLYAEPRLLIAALLPLAYVVVGALARLPDASVSVERTFEPDDPAPSDGVTVTLEVENTGERTLFDFRLIDGVPDELRVVSGSPRGAFALRPGESRTISYEVAAKRGDHEFSDPVVRIRTLTGTRSHTTTVEPTGESTLSCSRAVTDAPVERASHFRVGTRPTESGGEGVQFHSTREYQPGDPIARLDWRRYAKTGKLTTVQFHEERATQAVVVVDARPHTRVVPKPGYPDGAELSTYAAERLYEALVGANVATGLTALGVGDDAEVVGADGLPWVAPEGDTGTAVNARLLFDAVRESTADDEARPTASASKRPIATPDGGAPRSDGVSEQTTESLLARLPRDAHVVLVSPLLDEWPVSFARSLATSDHDLLVLSPAVAQEGTPGQTVAAVHRDLRLWDAELTGATTVDWDVEDPLGLALDRSLRTLLSNQ